MAFQIWCVTNLHNKIIDYLHYIYLDETMSSGTKISCHKQQYFIFCVLMRFLIQKTLLLVGIDSARMFNLKNNSVWGEDEIWYGSSLIREEIFNKFQFESCENFKKTCTKTTLIGLYLGKYVMIRKFHESELKGR